MALAAGLSRSTAEAFREEARKLPAFFRRDLLVMLSYRLALVSDWFNLLLQIALFAFVGRMVDPQTIPAVNGAEVSYVEFVAVGIAVAAFVQVGLTRVVAVIRNEQLTGTLESLMMTPTAMTTLHLGSAVYDLIYVPVRTVLFLLVVAALFDVHFTFSGLVAAVAVLAVFVPVVWGLGVTGAAAVLTFRRGTGLVGALVAIFTAASGAYFPVELLPGWAQAVMRYNPVTVALHASRATLLGNAGWAAVVSDVALLAATGAVTLTVGTVAFRMALQRELRRGTLALY